MQAFVEHLLSRSSVLGANPVQLQCGYHLRHGPRCARGNDLPEHEEINELVANDVIRPTATLGAVEPSLKEKGSHGTQSENDACSTKRRPHKLKRYEPDEPVVHTAICLKAFDDGQLTHSLVCLANIAIVFLIRSIIKAIAHLF